VLAVQVRQRVERVEEVGESVLGNELATAEKLGTAASSPVVLFYEDR
jgi:hypothetical protein